MRCEEVQAHVIEGTLPAEGAAHLEGCPECRELQALWQALGRLPAPPPDPGLPARFRARLLREPHPPPRGLAAWGLPLAASALLMLGGAFAAGYALRGESPRQAALGRLRRGTPAQRMQAIALAASNRDGDPDLAGALLERVQRDPSPEVRLAAVEALYLFGSDPGLGARIAEALPRQDRPEVQLALVDLVVALRERRAAEALRRLLREGRLGPEAGRRAEARLAEQRL